MIEIEQNILKYLQGRKTASTISQVSKKFNVTYGYAAIMLRGLADKKLVNYVRAGGTKLYVFNYQRSSAEVRSASTKDGVVQPSQGGDKKPNPTA